MQDIGQTQTLGADPRDQGGDPVGVGEELHGFWQRARQFEEVVFMQTMAAKTGCGAKHRAAGNAQCTRGFEQPVMYAAMAVFLAFLNVKAQVDGLHDFLGGPLAGRIPVQARIWTKVHTPSAVQAREPSRCTDAAASAQTN